MSLERMLLFLMEYNTTGILKASLPPTNKTTEPMEAIVTVQQGKLVSCLLVGESSRVVYQEGETAKRTLSGRTLAWTISYATSPENAPGSFPMSPPTNFSPVRDDRTVMSNFSPLQTSPIYPLRKQTVSPQEIMSIAPEQYRHEYVKICALCDGMHSLEQIAAISYLPIGTVMKIVMVLNSRGYITLAPTSTFE